ncbi:hypothetical protein BIZ78_gp265 [Erwinia phage vB_EamM_Caitlin]|uniref:hypothetical protein n=1 Tax=Erwinia phage vB_EamM_Caitlin TaxID=1883379 RepID=UPI00081CC618|nr:hypothetical protein BIZ78_gp265 [Erwinia phage vB_EamM_Caitlin]ANZ48310.1 hypothetical protein CAITLIN_15 [Erwinia phage vB_EamM_Caitlin]
MANMTMNYSFVDLMNRYGARDIFKEFKNGVMPGDFRFNSRYDELLHDEVFGFVFHHPFFREWKASLVLDESVSAIRLGDTCPVIHTGYNLSIQEVRRFRNDGKVISGFMRSMANSLNHKALPYDEVFALIMDALFTAQHVMGSKIENVH